MLKLLPKLLALLAVAAVAPASANHPATAAVAHQWPCPHERAQLAAAGYEPVDASAFGDAGDGSLFDPGRRASFLP